MSKNRNLADLLDSTGDVKSDALDNVSGLPDAIDVNASAPADSLAITSSGNVGIGTTSPGGNSTNRQLTLNGTTAQATFSNGAFNTIIGNNGSIGYVEVSASYPLVFYINSAERMRITSDGRGLSQFTAKAWVNFDGDGTVSIRDSHNVSSITDHGVGEYTVNFTNSMSNANYSAVALAESWHICLNAASQMTTTSCRFYVFSDSTGSRPAVDVTAITVQIFGD